MSASNREVSLYQVLWLFSLESVFFIVLLCACLKFASIRHRKHLRSLLEQVKKAEIIDAQNDDEKINNEELRRRLMEQIQGLKKELRKLKKIEQEYTRLKNKYESPESRKAAASTGEGDRHVIEVGTTVDRETGVEPGYLNFLARKKCLTDASSLSARAHDENKAYAGKIKEQKDLIASLLEQVQKYEVEAGARDLKEASRERTIESLKGIAESLNESQTTSTRLGVELDKVKRELQNSQEKVVRLEQERKSFARDNKKSNQKKYDDHSYTIISRSKGDQEKEAQDLFSHFDMENYEALKKEVEKLRETSKDQRQMIFAMEAQLLELKNDLNDKDMSEEEKLEKELEIKKLERLLMESEGCINVLESEVSYLQDRIDNITHITDDNAAEVLKMDHSQEHEIELTENLEKARLMLSRAAIVHEKVIFIVELIERKGSKDLSELLASRTLESLEQFAVDVHLRVDTRFGQVDVSNCSGIQKHQLELLGLNLGSNDSSISHGDDGFVAAGKHVGVFVRARPESKGIFNRLEDAVLFVVMVSDAVATALQERQVSQMRNTAIQRVVESVKKNLNSISIQNKYQSQEAKRVIESFLKELNQSLNTLNITENQSKFFDEMILEVHGRMEVLLASEVAVDGSIAQLMEKLDKDNAKWET